MSDHVTIGALMDSIERLTETNGRLLNENDTLRGLVAKGQGDCIYCGLKAEDMAKCASGFPGCGRMDDLMTDQENEKDRQINHLRASLLRAQMRLGDVPDGL